MIENMKIWRIQADLTKETFNILKEKIKECGLLIYVLLSRQCYNSFSIKTLSELFEIEQSKINKIFSKVLLFIII